MRSSLIIVLEFVIVIGVVFGWAFWELWSLRRDRKRPPQ